jgi:competence protein ComEC
MVLKRYALACCVLAYMAGIVVLHLAGLFPRPGLYDLSRLLGSSQIVIEGRVLDAPIIRWNQTRFLLEGKATTLSAFHGKTLVTLTFPDEDLAPGDVIRVRGWPSAPRPATVMRDFDERGYWASRQVFSMLKVWSLDGLCVQQKSSPWSLSRAAWTFHKRYRAFWERFLSPEESALLLGTTIGARGILPRPIKEACIRAGVYHIVVVSGQNMSLIVGLGVSLLLALQVPRRHALWICAFPIIFYTAAVGGDPPVVRAAVMALVGLLTVALGRDIPRYYPLLLAAGWILIQEPEAFLGASFQLSFGATLSILAILPLWDAYRKGKTLWIRLFKDAVLMGLAVHIGIWPFLIFYFHRLSFGGFMANWTVFPLSGVLMVLGLSIGTWGVLAPSSVPGFLLQVTHIAVHATLALIKQMASWRWVVCGMTSPPWYAIGLYYGLLFSILFMIRRREIHASYEKSRPRI